MIEDIADLNTGSDWSEVDIREIKWQVKSKVPVNKIAQFLCRTEMEILDKARELGLGELERVKAPRERNVQAREIGFDDDLLEAIEEWRRKQFPRPRFSDAVRLLVQTGLDAYALVPMPTPDYDCYRE